MRLRTGNDLPARGWKATIMGDNEQRLFDALARIEARQTELHGRVEQLVAYRIVDSQKLDKVDASVQKLREHGCVLGEHHEARIKMLEDKPAKAIGVVAAVTGILTALGSGVLWLVKSGKTP